MGNTETDHAKSRGFQWNSYMHPYNVTQGNVIINPLLACVIFVLSLKKINGHFVFNILTAGSRKSQYSTYTLTIVNIWTEASIQSTDIHTASLKNMRTKAHDSWLKWGGWERGGLEQLYGI